MNTAYRYILEPYNGMNTRYRCPGCQRGEKTFSLYIDTETGAHVHNTVGRCNREVNCGYHYTPKQYFQDNNIQFDKHQHKANNPLPVKQQSNNTSFIPFDVFKASLSAHKKNHFVQFLIYHFGVDIASDLVSRYFIGTSKHWEGSTVFWQIDMQGKVRTGKIMLYKPDTGKRVREPFNHITWAHTLLKQPVFELKQCLFGEHLLIDKTMPVAIVESEKTAIIASAYLPGFIWMAAGSLTNLNAEKCSMLQGRAVTLFPDLNGFDKWRSKSEELSHIATFAVSDLLERKATEAERKQGFDLADYLIKYDYKDFATPNVKEIETTPAGHPLVNERLIYQTGIGFLSDHSEPYHKESWLNDISQLENYFSSITLPVDPIKLNQCTTINNCSGFVETNLSIAWENNGNRTYLPYLKRLQELQQLLTASEQILI